MDGIKKINLWLILIPEIFLCGSCKVRPSLQLPLYQSASTVYNGPVEQSVTDTVHNVLATGIAGVPESELHIPYSGQPAQFDSLFQLPSGIQEEEANPRQDKTGIELPDTVNLNAYAESDPFSEFQNVSDTTVPGAEIKPGYDTLISEIYTIRHQVAENRSLILEIREGVRALSYKSNFHPPEDAQYPEKPRPGSPAPVLKEVQRASEATQNKQNSTVDRGDTLKLLEKKEMSFQESPFVDSIDLPEKADSIGTNTLVELQLKHYAQIQVYTDSIKSLKKDKILLETRLLQLKRENKELLATHDSVFVVNPVDRTEHEDSLTGFKPVPEKVSDPLTVTDKTFVDSIRPTLQMKREFSHVLYFDNGSIEVRNPDDLTRSMDTLNLENIQNVYLSAFTDNSGTDEVNRYISRQRLEKVSGLLVEFGIDPKIIFYQNHGKKYASEIYDPKDRKVELLITFKN